MCLHNFILIYCSYHVKENHGQAIFGISFNQWLGSDQPLIFATAGSNRCTIYECPRQGSIKLLMCYADPDVSLSFKHLSFED